MTELEALNNAAQSIEDNKYRVIEYNFNDKRKTNKKYFLQIVGLTISPVLDYENMNHFILGFLKAKELYTQKY